MKPAFASGDWIFSQKEEQLIENQTSLSSLLFKATAMNVCVCVCAPVYTKVQPKLHYF